MYFYTVFVLSCMHMYVYGSGSRWLFYSHSGIVHTCTHVYIYIYVRTCASLLFPSPFLCIFSISSSHPSTFFPSSTLSYLPPLPLPLSSYIFSISRSFFLFLRHPLLSPSVSLSLSLSDSRPRTIVEPSVQSFARKRPLLT